MFFLALLPRNGPISLLLVFCSHSAQLTHHDLTMFSVLYNTYNTIQFFKDILRIFGKCYARSQEDVE